MTYSQWQLEIIIASSCMSYQVIAQEMLREMVKIVWESEEN